MIHPHSPRAYCDKLGLHIDASRYNNPAIIGATGKRHYYSHGRMDSKREACRILRRLARMKGIALT